MNPGHEDRLAFYRQQDERATAWLKKAQWERSASGIFKTKTEGVEVELIPQYIRSEKTGYGIFVDGLVMDSRRLLKDAKMSAARYAIKKLSTSQESP